MSDNTEHEWEPDAKEMVVHREEQEFSFPLVTEEQIRHAEKSVQAINRIKAIALQVTGSQDWVDMGGKPYLQQSGCMKVARLFGVSFGDLKVEKSEEQIEGKRVIRFNAVCTARFNGGSVEIEGAASTDDDFFGKRKGQVLPLGEINLNNVRKKAVTNAQSRALKKILGIDGLSWEDVRGAGVEQGTTASMRYGGQRAAVTTAGADVRTKIGNMLADLSPWLQKSEADLLDEFSGFTTSNGKRRACQRVEDLSDKWAASTLAKVQAAWDSMESQKAGGGTTREPGMEG